MSLVFIGLTVVLIFLPHNIKTLIAERFSSIFSADPRQTSGHYEYLLTDLKLLVQYPFGIGLGKATAYIGEVWNESSLFKVFTEMGVLSGIFYALFFIIAILRGIKYYKKENNYEIREILLIAVSVSLAYFVIGIVFPVWFSWFPAMIVWVFMALIFNFTEKNEKRPQRSNS